MRPKVTSIRILFQHFTLMLGIVLIQNLLIVASQSVSIDIGRRRPGASVGRSNAAVHVGRHRVHLDRVENEKKHIGTSFNELFLEKEKCL